MTTITTPPSAPPIVVPRDRTGREFKVGDTIVYAVRLGWLTNPTLRVAVVQEIVTQEVYIGMTWHETKGYTQVKGMRTKLAVWWRGMQRKRSYIINWDEALVLCGG